MKKSIYRRAIMVLLFVLFSTVENINFLYAQIITTVAGNGILGYSGDGGPATAAKFHIPGKVIIDNKGNLFIADDYNHCVRKVNAVTGIINTIAGTGVAGYNGDGISATSAQLDDPCGMAFDAAGNLFIGDIINHRVRKINAVTGIISTVAGTGFGAGGLGGYNGDGIPATMAELNVPGYISIDSSDNLFISDGRNYRIRKVDSKTNIITTIAGNGISGYTGDGGLATSAELMGPQGIAFKRDDYRNLFIADSLSNVRKIDLATGIITVVAGNGTYGYSGDGAPASAASIAAPFDIAFDASGNCYIAEFPGRIRKIDTFGIIHTVAGTTVSGYNGDGIPATAAELNETVGIAIDACGSLYIADASNERIRKVTFPPVLTVPTISLSGASSALMGSSVTITATISNSGSTYIIHWMNHGIEFTTTTIPSVTYSKPFLGNDTITARVVSTATYGCYDSTTSAGHIVATVPGGIASISLKEDFTIYPNPAHEILYLEVFKATTTYRLVSIVGAVLQQGELSSSNNSISIKALPRGIYMLEVRDNEGGKTLSKIVKE